MYNKTKGSDRDRNRMQRELVDGDDNAGDENNERTMKTKFFETKHDMRGGASVVRG